MILYTTGSGAPSTSYVAPFAITSGTTVKASATKSGMANSALATQSFTYGSVSTPTFTLDTASMTLTLASTPGAAIFYTTGSGAPTTPYAAPFSINPGATVKAYASKQGSANSAIASQIFTVSSVATPTFTLDTASMKLTLASSSGAAIFYTTGSGTPTTPYTVSFPITTGTTVKAYATKSGMANSQIGSQSFAFARVATPTFTLDTASMTLTIASTSGAAIFYTTGPGTPATPYTAPFPIASSTTVKAYATKNGMASSETGSQSFVFATVATPTFSLDTASTTLTISSASGAAIFYTTGNGVPATPYTVPFPITSSTTVKAYATMDGMASSETGSQSFDFATVATPTFSLDTATMTLTITSTTGAAILYTTDTGVPATPYESPFVITSGTTVRAIASLQGMANSALGSQVFTIEAGEDGAGG